MEHVSTAVICADCDVALVVSDDGDPKREPLPPVSELARIAVGGPWELEQLARELQGAGISSRIDAHASDPKTQDRAAGAAQRGIRDRLALYVRPADAERAMRVVAELSFAGETGAESAPPGEELDACPACGTAIPEGATACADCGLEFVAVETP